MAAFWTENAARWNGLVQFLTINDAGYESGLPTYNAGHDLPTLQDDNVWNVTDQYNAHKWYLYLLDHERKLRLLHYDLNIPAESHRLVAEVDTLVGELP